MRSLLMIILVTLSLGFSSPASGFCEGWEDGYQQALEDCLKVGLTPLCPLEPIGSDGYITGFGKGYAAAQYKHCE